MHIAASIIFFFSKSYVISNYACSNIHFLVYTLTFRNYSFLVCHHYCSCCPNYDQFSCSLSPGNQLHGEASELHSDLALTRSCCCFESLIDLIKYILSWAQNNFGEVKWGNQQFCEATFTDNLFHYLCFQWISSKWQKVSINI